MILIEAGIVIGLVAGAYGIKVVVKKMGYKVSKKKLKRMINLSFDLMDGNMIREGIEALKDFDGKHNTKKLNKYIQQIINRFRQDEDKPNLDEKKVKEALDDFDLLEFILEEDEDEEEDIKDEVEEKMEEVKQVLNSVEQRRREMILRKNEIRMMMAGKSKKMDRRRFGGMG